MPPQHFLNSRLNKDEDRDAIDSPQHLICSSQNASLEEQLHQAVEKGNQHKVAHLLAMGAKANSYENGMTPLGRALQKNQGDIALFLLRECRQNLNDNVVYFNDQPEAPVRTSDHCRHQVPLLLMAVRVGQEQVVRLLLDKGVDPNSVETPSQESALHIAAQQNLLHIAETIIKFEANVDKVDAEGNTPLHKAVYHGNTQIAKLLTAAGANLNIPDKNEALPLKLAIEKGNVPMVKDLLDQGALVHAYNSRGRTMLHSAVLKGSLDIVNAVLNRGAYGSAQDVDGETPLGLACEMRRGDIVEAIMESDNNSRIIHMAAAPYMGTRLPIHIAAAKGYTEIIDIMLKKGALVNQRDTFYRYTALFWAVRQGHTQTVLYLLQNGANPNLTEPTHGFSPLHLACNKDVNGSHTEIVKMLIRYGANVCLSAELSQKTALHIACENAAKDIFQYLLKCPNLPLDAVDNSGDTPLILAIKNNHVDLAQDLISSGCNISICGKGNETPFHCSVRHGHYPLAQVILQSGCEVNTRDHCGRSPLSELVHQVIDNDLDCDENGGVVFELFQSMLYLGANIGDLSDMASPLFLLFQRKKSDRISKLALYVAQKPLSLLQVCAMKIRTCMLEKRQGVSIGNNATLLPLPSIVKQQLILST